MTTCCAEAYLFTGKHRTQTVFNFVKKNTSIYDLGCSTGTAIKRLAQLVPDKSVKLIGIDDSPAMLKKAASKLRGIDKTRFELRQANLSEAVTIKNASVVMMGYTLQFVSPLDRGALISKIHEGLIDNGCLILVEKTKSGDAMLNRLYTEIYYEFKRKQGYSDKEIDQKREALENVLVPYRIDENTGLMKKSGFKTIDLFFKWYNFAGFVAIKTNPFPKPVLPQRRKEIRKKGINP